MIEFFIIGWTLMIFGAMTISYGFGVFDTEDDDFFDGFGV